MAEYELTTPIDDEKIRRLKLGDVVKVTGRIYTARDEAHIHALEMFNQGKELPVEFKGSAVYHCGPIMRRLSDDNWEMVAAGPTTSSRMNSLEPEFIEKFGVKAIIGKGGMSKPTVDAMQKFGCVYLSFTGGAAILASQGISKVIGVHWFDLGMPEALWVLDGLGFGPLIVAIDANGNSIYDDVEKSIENNIPSIRKRLGIDS